MVADRHEAAALRASLRRQNRLLRSSLILNPVENMPFAADLAAALDLHGLYNTDKVRSHDERRATVMQFAGRRAVERDSRKIYAAWAQALGARDVTLRVLSGLHAHIVLFMALARPGERVLLLPERAGGHISGKAILERLGLDVIEMIVDPHAMCVDIPSTIALCEETRPDYVMVDRSEGLVVEDFSRLVDGVDAISIFDASQYLTNVICGDHPNPFDAGFDLVVASVHKNFPGPQKALLATRVQNDTWERMLRNLSIFVSNMHLSSTYAAGLTLARRDWLAQYSKSMLAVAVRLEELLDDAGVPVIRRPTDRPPTHHIWVHEPSRDTAYETFAALERCRILTNFRLLPYDLGFGVRLGVNAAVRTGLVEADLPELAVLIAKIRSEGPTTQIRKRSRAFNESIWERHER